MTSSADFDDPLHEVAEARLRLTEQRYTAGRRAPSWSSSATPGTR